MLAFSSFQFSRSVVSDSLRPHELQHARLPCPSPTPGVHSDSCPLWRRQWQPAPVLLPRKSHGWRSLVGCSPWGCKESDTTKRLLSLFIFCALEKEMATHSSVLVWRIPGMGEPGGLPSMLLHRVRHDWSDLAAAALQKTGYVSVP